MYKPARWFVSVSGLFMSGAVLCAMVVLLSVGTLYVQPLEAEASESATESKEVPNGKTSSPAPNTHGIYDLEEVVVTAPVSVEPLTVTTNPKAPHQPVPAHDGAEYLKGISGFSIIRKGGTDGDPVFRGMSGSRLNILLDGQQIFGGCGGRMDPPTAYVFPESYDIITVIKGPQSVLNGPGSSAGAVLFERNIERFKKLGITFDGSLTFGSFGRNDQVGDLRVGYEKGYGQIIATRTDSDDYEDGDGNLVHSFYTRWSTSAAVGWTPNDETLLEISAIKSDGRAAYADRMMDGSKFDRENVALKFIRQDISHVWKKLDAILYYNYVDHVMDNYNLRSNTTGKYSVNNPDRETMGGHIKSTLTLGSMTDLVVGADAKRDTHTFRGAMDQKSANAANVMYESKPRDEDMRFNQYGVFGELTQKFDSDKKVIGGLRLDIHEALDSRKCVASAMCPGNPNNTKGMWDRDVLPSGFIRYEGQLGSGPSVWYAGVGHAERFPDYWERSRYDSSAISTATGKSAFLSITPEKTTQLDVGLHWKAGKLSGSIAGFAGKVNDYILIRWSPSPAVTRNVDATVLGGESDITYKISNTWQVTGALAYVYGENDTDNKPLAQQPPLEFKLSGQYDNKVVSFGALWRLVTTQKRYDTGSGGIVTNGMDIGPTAGFGVLSLNAGWRPTKITQLTVGVDNVFDQYFAEHLSKSYAAVGGYLTPTNVRIYEPGRMSWVKFNIAYF
ncbi:TonB-denpendent receptor [Candidatus Magnetobacterium bavaricum]|uniref:TonB-denpendent receptor n=1 Tax=Candidatus Magnetobacterium bavaricum TaxID=29290 RepID=A0A0F3GWF7_9BACT|nr:TonB-denpendent receptor [Candidatus Magnetobacterium bavaricum]